MSQHERHLDRVTDEAALWFVRAQDPGFSSDDHKELASWLACSAEHVREYLSLAAITQDVQSLLSTPSADELIALAREAADDHNVVALLGADFTAVTPVARLGEYGASDSAALSPPARRSGLWASAATVVFAVAASALYFTMTSPIVYSTGIGEQVSFTLDDGSVVTLNAQSSLELNYTEAERNVRLIAGEALFNVAKYSERPFQVITERAIVRAIGTVFNVRYRGDDATVTVVEGIVDVQSPDSPSGTRGRGQVMLPVRLTVGQQARVASGEVAVIDTNVDKTTSWRERRLEFDSWTLSAVVQEFNLYNERRILIEDAPLRARSISGTFSADDRESFTLFLSEAGLAVSETRSDGTIVLRSANDVQ